MWPNPARDLSCGVCTSEHSEHLQIAIAFCQNLISMAFVLWAVMETKLLIGLITTVQAQKWCVSELTLSETSQWVEREAEPWLENLKLWSFPAIHLRLSVLGPPVSFQGFCCINVDVPAVQQPLNVSPSAMCPLSVGRLLMKQLPCRLGVNQWLRAGYLQCCGETPALRSVVWQAGAAGSASQEAPWLIVSLSALTCTASADPGR